MKTPTRRIQQVCVCVCVCRRRRRSSSPDFKDQSSLLPSSNHGFESSRSAAQPETEDAKGRHPPDAAVRSRDLDSLHEAGTPNQPFQPQLPSSYPEAEVAGSNLRHRCTGAPWNSHHPHLADTTKLIWSGHLVRMDDERLPKRLFYGDFATGSRLKGGQSRRYKDTLKSFLKRLQNNPTNWEDLALDRPTDLEGNSEDRRCDL
ncbi:hypothetical protein SprV_0702341300 [Sparganum proliferum]